MAHSYISVNNLDTERTICATDSLLNVFMYFFMQKALDSELDHDGKKIYEHYELELKELHISFIDLKLEEIYKNVKLKIWYSEVLNNLNVFVGSLGEQIDNNLLNGLPELNKKYSKPIPTKKIKSLINDLKWLLCMENVFPSEEYNYWEE